MANPNERFLLRHLNMRASASRPEQGTFSPNINNNSGRTALTDPQQTSLSLSILPGHTITTSDLEAIRAIPSRFAKLEIINATDNVMQALPEHVQKLSLSGSHTKQTLQVVASKPIDHLTINYAPRTAEDITELAGLKNGSVISLVFKQGAYMTTQAYAAFSILKETPKITSLDLTTHFYGGKYNTFHQLETEPQQIERRVADVKALGEALTAAGTIEHLHLSSCSLGSEPVLDALQHYPPLETLDLSDNKIDSVEKIDKLKNVKAASIDLSRNGIDTDFKRNKLLEVVKENQSIFNITFDPADRIPEDFQKQLNAVFEENKAKAEAKIFGATSELLPDHLQEPGLSAIVQGYLGVTKPSTLSGFAAAEVGKRIAVASREHEGNVPPR